MHLGIAFTNPPARFMVKGQPNEDAVLCTSDKTYTVRSIVLSNSVLVVTSDPGAASDDIEDAETDSDSGTQKVYIRDQLNEILELVPSVPRLHKLNSLLRGLEYDEGREDLDDVLSEDEDGEHGRQVCQLTYCVDILYVSFLTKLFGVSCT